MMNEAAVQAWAEAWVAAWAEMPDIGQPRTATIPTKAGGSFSYSYASLSDILDVVRPVLAKHGLAVSQAVVPVGDGIGVSTTITHAGGHSVAFGPTPMPSADDPRSVGSAITYARRYSLAAALGIATEADDDAAAATPKPTIVSEHLCPSCGSQAADNRAAHGADSSKPAWKCSSKACQGGGLRDKEDEGKGRWPWASWSTDQFDSDQTGDGDKVERLYAAVTAKVSGLASESVRRDIAEAAVLEAANDLDLVWPDGSLDRDTLNRIYEYAIGLVR